ncbi:Ferredoxin-type protein NapF [Neobacillus rhizosphaerae]|uniref:Ferredoxin-type protein NapF n=1 Tax=Neobacillus rhizosphaerae TaxID=2880965 RepID=A0ABN8KNY2_9BACI|nr:4Fe-4S binding protein [Neobacillus rhizosphaerae]CAH2715124.1 Ferredoxin-type protein NapF [Neobacillus rhizosphaerae]
MGLLDKWVESLDYQYEVLASCTRYKSPRSTCQRCLEVCEHNAITFENNHPLIERDKCIECGNCIAACPVQAVAGIFPKRTVIQNKLLISTDSLPTVKEMLILFKKGVREIIYEDSSLTGTLKERVEEVNLILNQLGEETFFVLNNAFEKTEEVYSRREIFSLWKRESQSFMKQVTPANWRFNHKQLDVTKFYPSYQFTNISLNPDKCTLCKACELLCEKKCFSKLETTFSIAAQSCSSCRLCEDICPENAIRVEEHISAVKEIHYPIYKKQCSICREQFETLREHEEQCVSCTKRKGFLSF